MNDAPVLPDQDDLVGGGVTIDKKHRWTTSTKQAQAQAHLAQAQLAQEQMEQSLSIYVY